MYTPVFTIIFLITKLQLTPFHTAIAGVIKPGTQRSCGSTRDHISVMTNFLPLLDWLKPIYISKYLTRATVNNNLTAFILRAVVTTTRFIYSLLMHPLTVSEVSLVLPVK